MLILNITFDTAWFQEIDGKSEHFLLKALSSCIKRPGGGGGIFRIPSERDEQSKDRKKIPRASNKTKKKSLDEKITKQSIPNFRTWEFTLAKGNSCDGESCCTVITTMDEKSTAKCNEAMLMDTPRNTAKENDAWPILWNTHPIVRYNVVCWFFKQAQNKFGCILLVELCGRD